MLLRQGPYQFGPDFRKASRPFLREPQRHRHSLGESTPLSFCSAHHLWEVCDPDRGRQRSIHRGHSPPCCGRPRHATPPSILTQPGHHHQRWRGLLMCRHGAAPRAAWPQASSCTPSNVFPTSQSTASAVDGTYILICEGNWGVSPPHPCSLSSHIPSNIHTRLCARLYFSHCHLIRFSPTLFYFPPHELSKSRVSTKQGRLRRRKLTTFCPAASSS